MPLNISFKISPSFIFLKSYKIISKSGMRLEVLMGNKISEKFVLTNEGSLLFFVQRRMLWQFCPYAAHT
jgi:hypothetical protein